MQFVSSKQNISDEVRKHKYVEFLPTIISKLGTCFATPEEEVIS